MKRIADSKQFGFKLEDEEELAYRALLYANEQDKLKKAKEAEKKEKLKVISESTMHFGKQLQKPKP